MLYFGLASIWGFLAGSAAVIIVMDQLGQPIGFGGGLGQALLLAAAIALVGGVIVSMAYREVIRRQ
jgi:hypothetical protein